MCSAVFLRIGDIGTISTRLARGWYAGRGRRWRAVAAPGTAAAVPAAARVGGGAPGRRGQPRGRGRRGRATLRSSRWPRMSFLVTRPGCRCPGSRAMSTLCSAAILRTTGDERVLAQLLGGHARVRWSPSRCRRRRRRCRERAGPRLGARQRGRAAGGGCRRASGRSPALRQGPGRLSEQRAGDAAERRRPAGARSAERPERRGRSRSPASPITRDDRVDRARSRLPGRGSP